MGSEIIQWGSNGGLKNGVYRAQKPENPENPGFNNYYFFRFFMAILDLNNTFKFLIGSFRSGLA